MRCIPEMDFLVPSTNFTRRIDMDLVREASGCISKLHYCNTDSAQSQIANSRRCLVLFYCPYVNQTSMFFHLQPKSWQQVINKYKNFQKAWSPRSRYFLRLPSHFSPVHNMKTTIFSFIFFFSSNQITGMERETSHCWKGWEKKKWLTTFL